MNGAYRSAVPSEFAAETCTRYAPAKASVPAAVRPFHATPRRPAASDLRASTWTTTPRAVSTVANGQLQPGPQTVSWNGKGADGKKLPAGAYQLHVVATSAIGRSELSAPITLP